MINEPSLTTIMLVLRKKMIVDLTWVVVIFMHEMYFRAIYGEENKRHLYVAYFPMGYGPEIKLKAHGKESELISEYKSVYGSLPPVDGRQGPEVMIREHAKALTVSQMKEHIRWCMNQLKMNGESIDE